MKEALWISDAGRVVCERLSCCGADLHWRIVAAHGLEFTHRTETGERFSRMSKGELAEFAPLISGDRGLQCEGGHVRYNPVAQELQVVEPAA